AVVGLPDEKWIEAITAVVVPKDGAGGAPAEADLTQWVKERLAPFKVPKTVRFVEDLPRNASGKILKRELRDRFSGSVRGRAPAASRPDVQPTRRCRPRCRRARRGE